MASHFEALVAGLPLPETEDEKDVGGDESVSEALSTQVFAPYQCRCCLMPPAQACC